MLVPRFNVQFLEEVDDFLNGILKKTNKTPQADLDKAERIRKQYFEQKKQKK